MGVFMKVLKIFQAVGYFALFLASLFKLINGITGKDIFGLVILIPLIVLGFLGIVCGIIFICKNRPK
jgi:hypothetical protein